MAFKELEELRLQLLQNILLWCMLLVLRLSPYGNHAPASLQSNVTSGATSAGVPSRGTV